MKTMTPWNPFSHATHGPKYAPHAITLRSGFITKVKNCFLTLSGDPDRFLGIIDYLTLGIGVFFYKITDYFNQLSLQYDLHWALKGLAILAHIVFFLLFATIKIINVTIAAVMTTIASILIIPLIHLTALHYAADDLEKALAVKNISGQTLKEFLSANEADLDDDDLKIVTSRPKPPPPSRKITQVNPVDIFNACLDADTFREVSLNIISSIMPPLSPEAQASITRKEALKFICPDDWESLEQTEKVRWGAFFRLDIGRVSHDKSNNNVIYEIAERFSGLK